MNTFLQLALLGFLAFVQNAVFCWCSRTRNQQDIAHHRVAAFCSGGVWFVTNVLVWQQLWHACTSGNWVMVAVTGFVYTVTATEGSVLAMRFLIGKGR